ncbi:MAG: hypothetical protein ACRDTK_15105 [Mycobacterium sp.]
MARTVDAADWRTEDAAHCCDGAAVKYRLDVVASSPADVVCSAGGWLYDRAGAGWEVNVLLGRQCDIRPLQILGVRASDLESQFAPASGGSAVRGLAVSATVFASDARIRERVLEALEGRMTEVTLWDEGWPLAVGHRTRSVQHVLSGAARAFKRHALTAAGISAGNSSRVGAIETLRSDMKTCLPVDSVLIPVG